MPMLSIQFLGLVLGQQMYLSFYWAKNITGLFLVNFHEDKFTGFLFSIQMIQKIFKVDRGPVESLVLEFIEFITFQLHIYKNPIVT